MKRTPSCWSRLIVHVFVSLLMLVPTTSALGQVFHVEEMKTEQIRSLDRPRTAVLIPGGILEEHGPYLPAFTDGYMSERMTEELAAAIAARPGWKALVFPMIPLGAEGFNNLGGNAVFPGTYTIRSSRLRAVYMDLASDLGQQGFRWIFIVHIHGAGLHNRALDQASDFFHDTYGGQMVHLWGLIPVLQAWGNVLTGVDKKQAQEDGVSLHAGMDETSLMLYLKPSLVSPGYKTASVRTGHTLEESFAAAKSPDWPGYIGSPRLGNAALGEKIWKALSASFISHALKILDGADPHQLRRYGDALARVPPYAEMDRKVLVDEKAVEAKQASWLAAKNPLASAETPDTVLSQGAKIDTKEEYMPTIGPTRDSSVLEVKAVAELEKSAMTRGDMDQYASILAKDAVYLPPNTTAKTGNELRAWLKDFLDHYQVEWLKWVGGETVVMGNFAYHDYAYSMKSTPKAGGDPVVGNGKGVEVYRRDEDRRWKIVRNIWNAAPEPTVQ